MDDRLTLIDFPGPCGGTWWPIHFYFVSSLQGESKEKVVGYRENSLVSWPWMFRSKLTLGS